MAVATQPAGFVGEMDRSTLLEHYWRLRDTGTEKDAAISQMLDAIIYGNRAVEFVRAFGGTVIKGIISNDQASGHPAALPALAYDERNGHAAIDTHPPLAVPPVTPDRDDGDGQGSGDAHAATASSSPPEQSCADGQSSTDTHVVSAIPQGFPAPGAGRVFNMARLRDPRPLTGVLAAAWSVDDEDVPLGLMTKDQCFKLAKKFTRVGKTQIKNGTMFRRLGHSLDAGQVVADRWDEAGIMTQFQLAEPTLA